VQLIQGAEQTLLVAGLRRDGHYAAQTEENEEGNSFHTAF
jgi:hypothetical protein